MLESQIETLDLAAERPRLPFARVQLIAENTNLIAENLHLLLEVGESGCSRLRAALVAPVDLVEAGGQGDKGGNRENDRKPQSYVPAAHVVDTPKVARPIGRNGHEDAGNRPAANTGAAQGFATPFWLLPVRSG